ncbi:MAG: hypothetical protein K2J72_09435, partial [Oscillospiraceae bacterium]|nr:hypothetical protein [Oscillospiraceae bacterium]
MKTVHRTVFKGYFAANRNKEGRSCSPLLEMALAISHLLLRFGGYAPAGAGREFRPLRRATKGLRPLDFCELGSARPALVGGFAA